MNDIIKEIIGGLIVAVLVSIYTTVKVYSKYLFPKEYSKLTYYRVIRIRFQDRGDSPDYIRRHHTIAGVEEPVYDETWCFNGTQCTRREQLEPIRMSSSGMVDAIQIMPVLGLDSDNHPHTRSSPKTSQFSNQESGTQLAAVGTMINGLQKSEDWWYGTTAQHEGQTLFLVLDFTSLAYDVCPISDVTSSLERDRNKVPKQVVEQQWFEDHIGNGLYYLKYKNAKKGDVIKFTFLVKRELIPIFKRKGS